MTESAEARREQQRRAHLHTAENWRGGTVVVAVSGEIDMLTAPLLEAAINAAVEKAATAIIVDLREVDFMASAGMDVLLVAHRTVTRSARFGVVADGRNIRRPIELVGLHHVVAIYATLDDALGDLAGS